MKETDRVLKQALAALLVIWKSYTSSLCINFDVKNILKLKFWGYGSLFTNLW
jgi:hypothetical protein